MVVPLITRLTLNSISNLGSDMALSLPKFPGLASITVEVDATVPKVVYELDFTTDMTTKDVSSSAAWASTVDHDIKKADGTTTKVILSSSYLTGTRSVVMKTIVIRR